MNYYCNTHLVGIHCAHRLKDIDPQCKGCKSNPGHLSALGQGWADVMRPTRGMGIPKDIAHEKKKARARKVARYKLREARFEAILGEEL